MKVLLVCMLWLTACWRKPPLRVPHVDRLGGTVVNAYTVAADYVLYAGIAAMLIGLILLIFLKMTKVGGLSLLLGFSCVVFAQMLASIGDHALAYTLFFMGCLLLSGYVYIKAITVGVPWLEKALNKDLNNDTHIA